MSTTTQVSRLFATGLLIALCLCTGAAQAEPAPDAALRVVRWKPHGPAPVVAPGESASQAPRSTAMASPAAAALPGPVVRLVYLVPSDRTVQTDYRIALEKAIRHLQIWYRNEMGDGRTFMLHDPVVEVVSTTHPAAWYSTEPNGPNANWFFNNVVGDGFALTGGSFDDPSNIWLYYIDADPACGQIEGAGTSGVAELPANDLRGLTGQRNKPVCPTDPPDLGRVCRWVGGLGHELGHALGLPHPAACEDSDPDTPCPDDSLLWTGYYTYTKAHLLDEDKQALAVSPFFSQLELADCLFACSCLVSCPAACPVLDAYYPSVVQPYDGFGTAVALNEFVEFPASSEYAVIGASQWTGGAQVSGSGAAYVMRRVGMLWERTATLKASDGAFADVFGESVAVSGDTVIVGARAHDGDGFNAGAAYVFQQPAVGWFDTPEIAKLRASDAGFAHAFGTSVAIHADVAAVGAPGDDLDNLPDAGSVYVFHEPFAGWGNMTETFKLVAPDADAGDVFGEAVSLSGNLLLVGAYNDGHTSATFLDGSGSAYVFRFNGLWLEEAKLTPADGQLGDCFGWSAAISGETALVGAPGCPLFTGDPGAAYVFRFDGTQWNEEAKLVPADGGAGDRFGWTVSLSGDIAVIGSPGDDDHGPDSGSAYLFQWVDSTWVQVEKRTADDGAPGAQYGRAVAVCGGVSVVGAPRSDSGGTDAGEAYIYRDGADCNGNGSTDECEVIKGLSPDCNSNAIPDSCDTTDIAYRHDDGSHELSIGAGGGDLIWLNAFDVVAGADNVSAISVAWGSGVADGTPTTLLLYADPNDDGDPVNAQLLASVSVPSSNADTNSMTTVSIPPTFVGGPGEIFFVGAKITYPGTAAPASQDGSSASAQRSWIALAPAGQANVANLAANPPFLIDAAGYPGNWLLRAGAGGASPDADGNGMPDECDTGEPAGTVADGGDVPGAPVTMDKQPSGQITVVWGGSCGVADQDFAIYSGELGDFTNHTPLFCSTGGSNVLTFTPQPGSHYYLVVPLSGTREGSYGTDSSGAERPQAASPCLPRESVVCP